MTNKKHFVIEDSDDSDDKTNDYTSQYNNNEIVIPNNHHRLNNDNKNEIGFLNDDEFMNDKNYYNNDNDNMEKANQDVERLKQFYRIVFGDSDNEDVENLLFNAYNSGPEQSVAYTRQSAQNAAACCPNGCHEERLRRERTDELECLERDCVLWVKASYTLLQKARSQAVLSLTVFFCPCFGII